MTATDDAIVVFTARSPARIIREGGSQSWVLNAARAKSCQWLVCTQNRHHPDHTFSDATEPHGAGFLVGKISGIRPSREPDGEDRWHITISEYARIHVPDLRGEGRNPVRYASLADLGIDPSARAAGGQYRRWDHRRLGSRAQDQQWLATGVTVKPNFA